jgi:hypothetical protein
MINGLKPPSAFDGQKNFKVTPEIYRKLRCLLHVSLTEGQQTMGVYLSYSFMQELIP